MMRAYLYSLMFASFLALAGGAFADDMDFYYGRAATTQPSSSQVAKNAEDAATIEPAAGPVCPKLPKNPCGRDNATVYKADKHGCQQVLRCGKAIIW